MKIAVGQLYKNPDLSHSNLSLLIVAVFEKELFVLNVSKYKYTDSDSSIRLSCWNLLLFEQAIQKGAWTLEDQAE